MKNINKWSPTKFELNNGHYRAGRGKDGCWFASRLNVDILASFYEKYLPLYARGRLVDLGCGKVPLFEMYRNYVSEIICVDWSDSLHLNQHLDLECDLSKELPFANEEFETIVLSDVLEHIACPELLWSEMRRILSPGGKIILNVPFFYLLHETPHDFYRYTEFALRRFAQNHQFKILHLEPVGGSLEIFGDFLAKNFQSIPVIGKPLAIGTQTIIGHIRKTKLGRKIYERSSPHLPLGYFMVAERQSQSGSD